MSIPRILAGAALALTTSLAVIAVGPATVAPAGATTPGPNGPIVVSYYNSLILSFDPDAVGGGSDAAHYEMPGSPDNWHYLSSPTWSPDGNRLAFIRRYGLLEGTWLIIGDAYTQDPSNWTYVQVDGFASNPTWSPDGSRIAFESLGAIYIIDADGSHRTRLTSADDSTSYKNPAWSPDGKTLAVEQYGRIAFVDVRDGSVSTTGVYGEGPAWSPDGTKIAYSAVRGSDLDIFMMNADGSDQTPITGTLQDESAPSWSPDGTMIAYQRMVGTRATIRKVQTSAPYTAYELGDGADPDWGAAQGVCQGRQATVTGTAGNDVLRGSIGDDVIQGMGGDDTIIGGGGHDVICGGAGIDTASYADHTGDVTAVIGDTSLRTEDDIYTDVENLLGGSGDDRLIGNDAWNVLQGGRGEDLLKGGDGDDVIQGQGGDDELRGGADNDSLSGGADGDLLIGGPGSDTATYDGRDTGVVVTIGDALSNDGNKTDGAVGYRDLIKASTENVSGTGSNDTLTGNDLDNVIIGGAGADTMRGGLGADTLIADDGIKDAKIDCGGDLDPAAQYDVGLDPAPASCTGL